MEFVELGKVGRPHGYRGGFVAVCTTGQSSMLGLAKTLFIGNTSSMARSFPIVSASWMPKGWKLKVSGIESDADVKKLRGNSLFVSRAELPATEEDEFYVGDLIGAQVLESETERLIGLFAGVESIDSAGQTQHGDRWWIDIEGELFPILATRHYIKGVDLQARTIWVQNVSELS